jgi:hypothetical protein
MPVSVLKQGAVDQSWLNDLYAANPYSKPITLLTGSADVLNPSASGNYIVNTAGVNAMTLAAPRVGVDDGLVISVVSDTTNAHTITATSLLANGTALKTTATFAAFRGAGIVLRAFNGVWQQIGNTVVTLT